MNCHRATRTSTCMYQVSGCGVYRYRCVFFVCFILYRRVGQKCPAFPPSIPLSHIITPRGTVLLAQSQCSGGTVCICYYSSLPLLKHPRFLIRMIAAIGAGWIPSVGIGVPTMEAVLTEGTPGLNPDDLQLPALPPVDEEVSCNDKRESLRAT